MAEPKVTIRFAGKDLTCRPETTVAVALWENGVRHLSHSPKYGRPRGVTCARGHCTACLMRVDGVPNVRVCETQVRDGMAVERQDAGAVYGRPMQKALGAGGSLFPVGFYYKWFTRPAWLSRLFLRGVRPLAGVGRLPSAGARGPGEPDAAAALGSFDTIVVGGGRSGMRAAVAAAGRVLLIDDHVQPGGQRREALAAVAAGDRGRILDRFPALAAWRHEIDNGAAALAAASYVNFRPGCRAVAGFAPDGLVLREGSRLLTATSPNIVWAAGAMDALGLFPGNDTPGLMGPRALYRLLTRDGMDVAGRQVLLIGGGIDFWLSAALLASRGARLNLVVEEAGWQSEVSAAVDLNWQLTTGLRLARVEPRGEHLLRATFVPRSSTPGPAGSRLELEADIVVVCQRGKPVYDIPYQLGADLTLDPARGGFLAEGAHPGPARLPGGALLRTVGEAAGLPPAADPGAEGRTEAQVSHE